MSALPAKNPGTMPTTGEVVAEIDLRHALTRALQLIEQAEVLSIAFADLGEVDLPPIVGSQFDQAALRAAAPLYLASELEHAGLIPAAEMLAGLFRSGALSVNVGSAPRLLMDFWRDRRNRFTAQERGAFFARLFGSQSGPGLADRSGSNAAFEGHLLRLAEALRGRQDHPVFGPTFGPHAEVRVRLSGRQLAENLSQRSGGITAFAARDIISTIGKSLAILKEPMIQRVVGARSVWDTIRRIIARYRNRDVDVTSHVLRGRSGLQMLAWLAESLPRLNANAPLPVITPELINSATQWLQASLTLTQQPK